MLGGGGNRSCLPEAFCDINGAITLLFRDLDVFNKALNGAATSLKFTLGRGDGLGSLGNESITFFINLMEYELSAPPIESPGGIEAQFNYSSYSNSTLDGLPVEFNPDNFALLCRVNHQRNALVKGLMNFAANGPAGNSAGGSAGG